MKNCCVGVKSIFQIGSDQIAFHSAVFHLWVMNSSEVFQDCTLLSNTPCHSSRSRIRLAQVAPPPPRDELNPTLKFLNEAKRKHYVAVCKLGWKKHVVLYGSGTWAPPLLDASLKPALAYPEADASSDLLITPLVAILATYISR